MFHKNVLNAANVPPLVVPGLPGPIQTPNNNPARLVLVPSGGGRTPQKRPSPLIDLVAISAHRCSAFFAEAAVLVLVLTLLDRFMLKGRMELGWAVSAFSISLMLLAASIVTEFSARRWLQRH
jgi:hypothetical protein